MPQKEPGPEVPGDAVAEAATDKSGQSNLARHCDDLVRILQAVASQGSSQDDPPIETNSVMGGRDFQRDLTEAVAKIEHAAPVNLADLIALRNAAFAYAEVIGREPLPLLVMTWAFLVGVDRILSAWSSPIGRVEKD